MRYSPVWPCNAVPTGHGAVVEEFVQYCPAAHGVADDEPSAQYDPMGQAKILAPPVQNDPVVQRVHPSAGEVAPNTEPNLPASQRVHCVAEINPVELDQLPAGQGVEIVGSVQYDPAGHAAGNDEPAGQ